MLDTFVNRSLDQAPYTGRILRYLISRYPQQSVALLSQITVTTLIVLATIVRVMILTIHFKYQLQCDAAKVGCVWRDRILATKLLGSTPSIANNLPHSLRKLVGSDTLLARKPDCIWVAR